MGGCLCGKTDGQGEVYVSIPQYSIQTSVFRYHFHQCIFFFVSYLCVSFLKCIKLETNVDMKGSF